VITSFAERIRNELDDLDDLAADVRARFDEWLKADKEFNTWFLVTTKRALADDELMELLDGYRESQEIVERAWEDFCEKKNATMLFEGILQSMHRMELLQKK
jgi:hypothetical protein